MPAPSPAAYIIASRSVLQGPGNGEALENVNGQPLPSGAVCFVEDQATWYYFAKNSTASPSGTTIIATVQGTAVPGRWVQIPAGGGSGGFPLSQMVFVDQGTSTPAPDQNGAIATPYATITQGLDAGNTRLLICPGDYSAESIAIAFDTSFIAFPNVLPLGTPGSTSFINTIMPSLTATVAVTAQLYGIQLEEFDGTVGANDAGVIAEFCTMQDIIADSVNLQNVTMAVFDANPSITIRHATPIGLSAYNCSFGDCTIECESTVASSYMSDVGASFSFTFTGAPGVLTVDAYTAARLSDIGFTNPVNGSLTVVG